MRIACSHKLTKFYNQGGGQKKIIELKTTCYTLSLPATPSLPATHQAYLLHTELTRYTEAYPLHLLV